MIHQIKKNGGHAAKFQSYKASTLASKNHSPAYWDLNKENTKSQFELFSKHDKFGENEYKELSHVCKKIGLDFLSTPFDLESVDYLSELMPYYKIASADINNEDLIIAIAKKNKPVLFSTGASNIEEIRYTINLLEKNGVEDITILHCVLSYPTLNINANLKMIKNIKDLFPKYRIGYSDHTVPDKSMLVLTTAYLYGARVIEKHFTFDKNLNGNDHYHSMDSNDLNTFVNNINFINKISGQYNKVVLDCEKKSRSHARRSIFSKCLIRKGEIITSKHIINKRPGSGLPPTMSQNIIGKKALIDVKKDTMISLLHVSSEK